MFEEVIRRLSDIEPAGPVEWLRTNFNCGIKHMPVRFKPSDFLTRNHSAGCG